MKKFFIAIIAILIPYFLLAENENINVYSLSLSPFCMEIQDYTFTTSSSSEEKDAKAFSMKVAFGAEYNRLLSNNMILGIYGCFTPKIVTLGSDTLSGTLSFGGASLGLAPTVGYRFGENHFLSIEFLPIYWGTSFFDGNATYQITGNDGTSLSKDVKLKLTETELLSGLRANIQFGNGTVKNGFYVGLYIPWLSAISDVKTPVLDGVNVNKMTKGIQLEAAYRVSFFKN